MSISNVSIEYIVWAQINLKQVHECFLITHLFQLFRQQNKYSYDLMRNTFTFTFSLANIIIVYFSKLTWGQHSMDTYFSHMYVFFPQNSQKLTKDKKHMILMALYCWLIKPWSEMELTVTNLHKLKTITLDLTNDFKIHNRISFRLLASLKKTPSFSVLHFAHTQLRTDGDKRRQKKKRQEERETDRQREKHVSPWEEVGSFLYFL